jgi:hypothetical protein
MSSEFKLLAKASRCLQQGHQPALAIQRDQIIAAAYMRAADENLRHGAPPGDLHHVVALYGIGINADFLNLLHALGFEDLLGANAVGANGRGVHFYSLHDVSLTDDEMNLLDDGMILPRRGVNDRTAGCFIALAHH